MAEATPPNKCKTINERPNEKIPLKINKDHENKCVM